MTASQPQLLPAAVPGRSARRQGVARVLAGVLWLPLSLGAAGCSKKDQAETPQMRVRLDGERFKVPLFDDDLALGGSTPLVTIVVYSDYACPPCGNTWSVMKNLVEDYGEDLRVVARSYTVPGFAQGEQAAEAAFAAEAQGKFWEMHWRLFQHAGRFDRPTLRAHAEAIGLDGARFAEDLDTGAFSAKRARHRREAKTLGIRGLPVMFVNGLYLAGFQDEAMWHGVVDEQIAHAKQMIADGTPRAKLYETLMSEAKLRPVQNPDKPELAKKLADKQAANFYPTDITPPEPDQRYQIRPETAPTQGPADAPVVIVEFVDFQCPYCQRAWREELREVLAAQPNNVRLAVRNLPLEIHVEARGAAMAALAAHQQDKFWPFHERLMQHEGELGRNVFVQWAKELSLDQARFEADLDDPALSKLVADDVRLAAEVGINGTPAFFVNGHYLSGFRKGALTALVAEELAEADKRIAAGTARGEVFESIMAEAIPRAAFPN